MAAEISAIVLSSDIKIPVFATPPVWKLPHNLKTAAKLDLLLQTLPAKHK